MFSLKPPAINASSGHEMEFDYLIQFLEAHELQFQRNHFEKLDLLPKCIVAIRF